MEFVNSQEIFCKSKLIEALLYKMKNRLNIKVLKGINAFLSSTISKGKKDNLWEKIKFIYCYWLLIVLIIFSKKKTIIWYEVKYMNFDKYIWIEKDLSDILIELSQEITKIKDENIDIITAIMKKIRETDFIIKE